MKLKIETFLEDKLKSTLFIYEEQPVEIEFIEDVPGFEIYGVKFSGAKVKGKMEVPGFFANWLIENHKAKIISQGSALPLVNSLKQQNPSFKVNQLPANLLSQSLQEIGVTSLMDDTNQLTNRGTDTSRLKETLLNLINERLKRLLRDLAINDYKTIEKNLDNFEKPFLKEVSVLLEDYLKIINFKPKK